MSTPPKKHWLAPTLAITFVLLVAAFLRLYLLAEVPVGWHHDEAVKALMAWGLVSGKPRLVVYFPSFTGREPLYIYLEALALALFGRSTFSVRVLSASIGMLTVAGTYHLGRRMFNRRVAWIAAGLAAASLWQVVASRNGYRAVLQPLVQLPAIVLMWRGLRSGRYRDYALAGVFTGIVQYVYPSARFFPVLLALFGIGVLVARRMTIREELPRWALMGGVALFVFVPLGIYFLQNPGDFLNRANQISIFNTAVNGGDTRAALLNNIRDTALMFSTEGDPNFRFNLKGRPVFTAPEAVLLGIGLALATVGLLWQKGLRRLAYLLLWLWLLVMLVPMLLTIEGIPYFQRALGIVPAVYLLPASALDWLLSRARKLSRDWVADRIWHPLEFGLLTAALIALTVTVRREYFVQWAQARAGYDDRGLDMVQVSEYVRTNESEETTYISTQYGQNPVTAWYAPDQYGDLHWFSASQTMVYPPPGQPAEYIFAAHLKPHPALLEQAIDLLPIGDELDSFGRIAYSKYLWPAAGQPPTPQISGPLFWSTENTYPELLGTDEQGTLSPLQAPVDVGHDVLFLGYDILNERFNPGDPLELILHWRILNVPDHPYTVFVHLIDANTDTYAIGDANLFLTLYWTVGETFTGHHVLWTPSDLPPGKYLIQLGMYNPDTGERATIFDGDGLPLDARILTGPIEIGVP